MPPKQAPYKPIHFSQLTAGNVDDHIKAAKEFLSKYKKCPRSKRGDLGGETQKNLVIIALEDYTEYRDKVASEQMPPEDPDDQNMEGPGNDQSAGNRNRGSGQRDPHGDGGLGAGHGDGGSNNEDPRDPQGNEEGARNGTEGSNNEDPGQEQRDPQGNAEETNEGSNNKGPGQRDSHGGGGAGAGNGSDTGGDNEGLTLHPTHMFNLNTFQLVISSNFHFYAVYTIAGRLSVLIVKGWEKAWLPKRKEFESSSYTSSAESYRPLTNASRALQSSVLKICREEGIDPAIIGWPLMPSGEPASLDELRKIQSWLLDNGLINEPEIEVVEKVATSKIPNIVIFDYEQRKGIRISKQMLKEARDDPEKWPGCVEVGMGIIHPLFLNHFGLEKCLSCKDGPRGKKKGKKDDPEYLTGCGCPVRTAALELWLTKVNAQNPAIPMREAEDGKIKRENAFNPTTLEFIEGGILAASGHTVDSLLQSEIGRLEHTANWAMDRMANLMQVENPAHCQTIAGVLVEFQKQMQGIKDQIRGQTIL
ncbi:hypothetical protein F5887DRAFT_925896 [Amanita rubescens]|nr:hypothetical protein F5887DRAFT_925896 [Amanita rubescens]